MTHVYMAYASRDQDMVTDIVAQVEDQGVNTWFDRRDIAPGESWFEVSNEALEIAGAMVVIMTEWALKKALLSVQVTFAEVSDIPVYILKMPNVYMPDKWSQFPTIAIEQLDTLIEQLPATVKRSRPPETAKQQQSKGYVFISYAIADLTFVEMLHQFFKNKEYAFWDYRMSSRQYHLPFHLEIEQAITEATVVVSVVSPDWKKSTWTSKEYLFAQELGKTNFVLLVRDVGPTLLIADVTHIDFRQDEDAGFETLDKALRREGLI